ncbi:MAG: sulfatase-like hydrolase/transferase [Planctomycetota bacterium]|jgi:uncharacterized sulfatase
MRRPPLAILALLVITAPPAALADDRPNILWITSEDNGPHLGCYGDGYADTPNLDALAARGMLFLHCWSNAPVCAPARTTIISGLYPTSTGAQHMRSMTSLPPGYGMFPQRLREAGYYCTNNSKEDYNLHKPAVVWDASSRDAHWRDRPDGAPFFAVFNFTTTHESQIRRRPHAPVHDPDLVRVPAYHPDLPAVRQDWAQYYDKLTQMDRQVGRVLEELEQDELAESTIVFYFADHGCGLPRSKRFTYDSGLRVPLIVRVPESLAALAPAGYASGARSERLVAFIDLAPTMLSLAGVRPPAHYQGRAFMGPYAGPAPRSLHGFRGRMDERYDMQRAIRDERYVYVRNYMPHLVYGQHVAYMFQTPTTTAWQAGYEAGTLTPAQARFWETKAPEELYDLQADPDEVRNLAGSPEHRDVLARLRAAQRKHLLRTRDLGFLPEAEMHARSAGSTPFEMGRDDDRYPLERIMATAETASSLDPAAVPVLRERLGDEDSAVRYWAALGLLMRGGASVAAGRSELRAALADPSASVRVTAAHALARAGGPEDLEPALRVLIAAADLRRHGIYVAMLALNALDDLDRRAAAVADAVRALPRDDPAAPRRVIQQFGRLIDKTIADLDPQEGDAS